MPRVNYSPRSRKLRRCGNCGAEIQVGEPYRYWKLRYGGKFTRCMKPECAPKPHELTSAKYGPLLSAVADAETAVGQADSIEDISSQLDDIISQAEDVIGEYDDSIEQSPNLASANGWEETRDMIEEFRQGLEDVRDDAPDEPETEVDCPTCDGSGKEDCGECEGGEIDGEPCPTCEGEGQIDCMECEGTGKVEDDSTESPLDEYREKALEALGNVSF